MDWVQHGGQAGTQSMRRGNAESGQRLVRPAEVDSGQPLCFRAEGGGSKRSVQGQSCLSLQLTDNREGKCLQGNIIRPTTSVSNTCRQCMETRSESSALPTDKWILPPPSSSYSPNQGRVSAVGLIRAPGLIPSTTKTLSQISWNVWEFPLSMAHTLVLHSPCTLCESFIKKS